MKKLSIIGCGRIGKTLGRLWHERSCFQIQDVLNRSLVSAKQAVSFIGEGRAISAYSEMEEADCIMISTVDQSIVDCAVLLMETGCVKRGTIVFHCSGSLSSTILGGLEASGARIASIHPIKSFADPELAVSSFAGTYCGVEGDKTACDFLSKVLSQCGATVFSIKREDKLLYHAGSVIVCNYLVALIEAGLVCYEQAGIDRDEALRIMQPIMAGTIANVVRLGTAQALTGPIARGEAGIVEQQCQALERLDHRVAAIYKTLGLITVDLSRRQGGASETSLLRMIETFNESGLGEQSD